MTNMYNNNAEYIDEQIRKVLLEYYLLDDVELFQIHTGMNNITRMVKHQGHAFNIRIYCNHVEREKVLYEHRILHSLARTLSRPQVPLPVSIEGKGSVAELDDGRLVALYYYIGGEQARSKTLLQRLTKATGILSYALAQLKFDTNGEYSPYYELKSNYPAFTLKQVLAKYGDPKLSKKLGCLLALREQLELKKEQFAALPHQLIHGDINFSNAVVNDNEVIGILDFEFVTYDVRVMELAILFTEYFKLYESFEYSAYADMITSFTEEQPLTDTELQLLPELIQLRAVDVAMHFLTRYMNGQDNADVFERICKESYRVVQQVNIHLQ